MEDSSLRRIIGRAKRLVFFGGAGVSTASGIPDFRSPAGLNAGARREIASADTLIIARTSLVVEPAASLIDGFSGRELVVINLEPTPADARASLVIRDDVARVFERLAEPA